MEKLKKCASNAMELASQNTAAKFVGEKESSMLKS